ncbi:TPA: hypothetical protein N0F65_005775 [Lagenidium giganteum]|uniref:Uncharacterized protein n=1 Tax=Lagenidium giganteum TaxID=4803 RepID=A0AAV2YU62_9STRA|nr:TPA: hypothetical protein N0F65_005775 [Lagenidium giganteum]
MLLQQEAYLKMAQDSMREAQWRMKSYYDKNRRTQVFSVGDEVLLNTAIPQTWMSGIKAMDRLQRLHPDSLVHSRFCNKC